MFNKNQIFLNHPQNSSTSLPSPPLFIPKNNSLFLDFFFKRNKSLKEYIKVLKYFGQNFLNFGNHKLL
jgi:hypothetical protein